MPTPPPFLSFLGVEVLIAGSGILLDVLATPSVAIVVALGTRRPVVAALTGLLVDLPLGRIGETADMADLPSAGLPGVIPRRMGSNDLCGSSFEVLASTDTAVGTGGASGGGDDSPETPAREVLCVGAAIEDGVVRR
jgi:hypothetical protein